MPKLTFRADDELVSRLEGEFDGSKSEVLRRALREYIERHGSSTRPGSGTDRSPGTLDDMITERVDSLVADRRADSSQDIRLEITLDGLTTDLTIEQVTDEPARSDVSHSASEGVSYTGSDESADSPAGGQLSDDDRKTCIQCGEALAPAHVYCPNCGEKSSRRVLCECGDELRSDWAYCPACGRRTPAAEVLEDS